MRWVIGALLIAAATVGARLAVPLPVASFDEVRAAYCPSDLRLLDRHGAPLHELRVDRTRRRLAWTPLEAISPPLVDVVLTSEDRRFHEHGGVDWRAVGAAIGEQLTGGAARGASTITMQLAALLDPAVQRRGTPRSMIEKWRQMRAAWSLERSWTKSQILEAYLNLVTFRGELQGIGAAAEVLFGKAPHGLTHAESAVLAALVRSPNADRAALMRRSSQLAAITFPPQGGSPGWGPPSWPFPETGEGIAERATLAVAIDRVVDTPQRGAPRLALAPHAAHRLLNDHDGGCEDTWSTLDAATQRAATDAMRRQLAALRDSSVRDAAVLVVDNASGDVLAYVAASGELSRARHVDGIQARRQAGSTLKPFLYGLALDQRVLTAATRLDDAPLEVAVGTGVFRPHNYDERFRGPVPVRAALAGSLNIPAVRTLLLLGPDAFASELAALGFAGIDHPGDYYGPSLALGSADVSLWELVAAYRALANGGAWSPIQMRGKRKAESGKTDEDLSAFRFPPSAPANRRVISAEAAFIINDILADRDSRAATFGLESPLATRFWSAVKTGTSKDMRDNWCIGFSRRYTVGVWVGNFSGAPMHDVSGIAGAAPIWSEVMEWLHRDLPSPPPPVPTGAQRYQGEWFLAGTAPGTRPQTSAAPRIVAPVDGSLIAVDPDIPAPRQRVAFEADSARALRWRLDGADLGTAAAPLLWAPTRGAHLLALVDVSDARVDAVRFEVRGSAQ